MQILDYLLNWSARMDATIFIREGRQTPQGRHCTYVVELVNLATGLTRETREFKDDCEGARRWAKRALFN